MLLSHCATALGSKRTHVPIRNEGIRPAFACLKTVIFETFSVLDSSSAVRAHHRRLGNSYTIAEWAKLNNENCWLHKFRATFATWSLWAGVDLRTVQQWLGHSDMESTMRYLKPSRSQQVRCFFSFL
jgi:integrase